jgi:tRNA-dihydrouridine synthase A
MTRHILGLFMGQRGARIWRRVLSENAHKEGKSGELLMEALNEMRGCLYA